MFFEQLARILVGEKIRLISHLGLVMAASSAVGSMLRIYSFLDGDMKSGLIIFHFFSLTQAFSSILV